MTEYVVFAKTKEGDGWGQIGPDAIKARSARAAISEVLSKRTDGAEGTFVAVPARSWQPVTVKVETALKFS